MSPLPQSDQVPFHPLHPGPPPLPELALGDPSRASNLPGKVPPREGGALARALVALPSPATAGWLWVDSYPEKAAREAGSGQVCPLGLWRRNMQTVAQVASGFSWCE